MRKFLMSAAMAASVLSAAPAMAQYNGNGYPGAGYPGGPGYGRPGQVSPYQLRDMVERAIQRREVPWQEARNLRAQVAYIVQLDRRYQNGGYSGWERGEIQRRTDMVVQRLRYARGNNGGYNNGYNNGGHDNGWNDDRRDEDRRGYDENDRGYDQRDRDDR